MHHDDHCNLKSARDGVVLDEAIKRGDKEVVKILSENGADVNLEDSDNNTILYKLISRNTSNMDILELLIRAGASVNHINRHGESPLMLAALENKLDLLKLLCQAGADVNVTTSTNEDNALSLVFEYFDTEYPVSETFECAEYLLEQGSDASYLRPRALHKLIFHGKLELIQKLIAAGMGPADDITDSCMNYFYIQAVSPLRSALFWGRPDVARIFMERLFLTASDLLETDDYRGLKHRLRLNRECFDLLNEVTSQPMPLKDLCFVVLSSTIGSGPQRRRRMNQMVLPPQVKRKLLFLC